MLFSKAFEIYHDNLEDFVCKRFNVEWKHYFDNEQFAFPLVHAGADFKAPVKANQILELQFECSLKSESTFAVAAKATIDGRVAFTVESVHVCVNKSTGIKTNLPAFITDSF